MGQKDRAEKYLENYNDVFADIYNVLVFKKRWILSFRITKFMYLISHTFPKRFEINLPVILK